MRNNVPLQTAQDRRGDYGDANSNVYIAIEQPNLRRKDLLSSRIPVRMRCLGGG